MPFWFLYEFSLKENRWKALMTQDGREYLQNKICGGMLRDLCVLCLGDIERQSGNIKAVSKYIKGYQSNMLLPLSRNSRNWVKWQQDKFWRNAGLTPNPISTNPKSMLPISHLKKWKEMSQYLHSVNSKIVQVQSWLPNENKLPSVRICS